MDIWTFFIIDEERIHPTTYIASHSGASYTEALEAAMGSCAEDWECRISELALLGSVEGDIKVVEWTDEVLS